MALVNSLYKLINLTSYDPDHYYTVQSNQRKIKNCFKFQHNPILGSNSSRVENIPESFVDAPPRGAIKSVSVQ